MPRPIFLSTFLAVAMIAGLFFVAPAHAGSPEAFYGHYEGSGTSRDPNVTFFELTQRDLDVRIGPDGAGFFVEWTTVIRDSVDAEVRRREARVAFDPSDRPGIYLARDAASAQGMAWASINDRTMTVRSLRILKNGSYAVQTYHRTITDDEMFLHFISDEDGQTIRMVTARLKKTSE